MSFIKRPAPRRAALVHDKGVGCECIAHARATDAPIIVQTEFSNACDNMQSFDRTVRASKQQDVRRDAHQQGFKCVAAIRDKKYVSMQSADA